MDEQPIQLQREVSRIIPATNHHAKRVDYEYERAGTASIFMFCEPLSGWREATVRKHRKKIDWALAVGALLEGRYKEAEKIILICDNLNTHTRGAFYDTYPPDKAQELLKRVEIHYTPKHGSWLNIAECELSVLTRQCLKTKRFPDISSLSHAVSCWSTQTNAKQRGVDWHFTVEQARVKLKSLYPKILF